MESKQNETFGIVIFQPNVTPVTWTLRQESHEAVTRGEGASLPLGAPPYLVAPSELHRRTPSSYIYLCIPV